MFRRVRLVFCNPWWNSTHEFILYFRREFVVDQWCEGVSSQVMHQDKFGHEAQHHATNKPLLNDEFDQLFLLGLSDTICQYLMHALPQRLLLAHFATMIFAHPFVRGPVRTLAILATVVDFPTRTSPIAMTRAAGISTRFVPFDQAFCFLTPLTCFIYKTWQPLSIGYLASVEVAPRLPQVSRPAVSIKESQTIAGFWEFTSI